MYSLKPLRYAHEALQPVIGAQTMAIHHGKHLQAYVDNYNKLVVNTPLENQPVEKVYLQSEGTLFNNAGQILNHEAYFEQFTPGGHPLADGLLSRQFLRQWASFEAFQADFVSQGVGLFGSGWVWLATDIDGTLHITREQGASNPMLHGLRPLLTFDVWEHAYYLDYQNRRGDYLNRLWDIVDWAIVEARYNRPKVD